METVLTWLGRYSAPIALLLALSAALIYLLQNVVEKTIAFQFDRYAKEISLKFEKRSNFEERILLDPYLITEQFHKILWEASQLMIAIANETDPERLEVLQAAYLRSLDACYEAMNDVFGIEKITWETR